MDREKLVRRKAILILGTAVALALTTGVATAMPQLTSGEGSLTAAAVRAASTLTSPIVADSTLTQVTQDGNGSVRTTLASCPQTCEGNPAGWRDPALEFAVTGVPAGATNLTARLQVYTWTATTATVTVHRAANGAARTTGPVTSRPSLGTALGSVSKLVTGYNTFDVTRSVTGNGSYTFALRQQTPASRVYWASKEQSNAAVRPRLTLTYDLPASPTASPSVTPTKPSPTTSASPTTSVSPTTSPTASPTQPPTTGPSPTPPGWDLVFGDEFNDSSLDKSKWKTRNTLVDYDKSCITDRPQNLFEGNGYLTLRALRENYTCGGATRPFTTTYVDTIGLHSWQYGRFEVRAKSTGIPEDSTGLWPAFWLRPDDGGNGEIDVTELPGGTKYYQGATQSIFRDYKPTKQDTSYKFPAGTYPGDGFHTYTTDWSSEALIWYIDGKEVWRRTPQTTPWYTEVFNKPYNLRLNLQVGGWLGDPVAATDFPADFQVDYVRVYQQ